MTHDHWKRLDRLHFAAARKKYPTEDLDRLRRRVTTAMVATFGKCPPKPPKEPKPPLQMRLGLWWLRRKLKGVKPLEVSMFVKKLVVSLLYGLGAAAPVIQLALADSAMSGDEWAAVMSAFIAAFWGKFSSNTTVLAPARDGETITGTGDGED